MHDSLCAESQSFHLSNGQEEGENFRLLSALPHCHDSEIGPRKTLDIPLIEECQKCDSFDPLKAIPVQHTTYGKPTVI